MITALPFPEIIGLIFRQLNSLFGISNSDQKLILDCLHREGGVFERLEYCFSLNDNKYYHKNNSVFFNPFHSGQYTIFLYILSHFLGYVENHKILADKIYYLNKVLNGCDLFYEINLPKFFKLDHPVGSVMGRAEYGEGFSFTQCCTVGNNKGIYPKIGKNVRMCANSSIIGNCKIGDNVIIGANSSIKDQDVPDNIIVFGQYPNNIYKERK